MQQRVKSYLSRLAQHEKVRFALVGAVNTLIDFVVLFLLVDFVKLSPIIANIISTSVALAVSYGLNKRSVFGDTNAHNPRQIILFVVITLTGLWVLQALVISFTSVPLQLSITKNGALFVAKVIATLFSLTWNYTWYSRVVFKKKTV